MAREVYRVEIPIEATDNYSAEIRKAEQSVTQFEASMKRSTSMANKRRNDFNRGKWSMTLNAVDKASRVVSRVTSYIHRVANRSYRFTLRAYDLASRAIGGVRRALTSIPAMVTVALSVIGAGKLKDATVGAAMSFEQYEVSMQHWLGGNEKKAKSLVKWMGQFADTTPFSSVDLFPALTRGLGVSNGDVKQAQDLLKLSADMAALTPEKSVSDAMEALADAQMGEMERLKEFNVKVSKKEFDKIGYAGVVKQLAEKFDGGAAKLSQTSAGIISTLKGYRSSLFRSMGEGFLDPMKPRLDNISKWLENNQDTWGRWKSTVKGHGKQASEFVFSNLEKGFGHVRERYLDNKEFMDLSFKGKVDFVMGDINQWWSSKGKPGLDGWWEGTGKPWASKIGLSIGEAIFEGMKLGITKGLEGIGDMWGNVGETAKENGIFSKETATSAAGAGIATLGAGVIGAMLLSPLLKVITAPFKAGKWVKGKMPGSKVPTPPIIPGTQKPSAGPKPPKPPKVPKGPVIVDQHGKPLSSSGHQPKSVPTPRPIVTETVARKKRTKTFQKNNWPGPAPGSAPYPTWMKKMIDRPGKEVKLPKQTVVKTSTAGSSTVAKQTTKAIEKLGTKMPKTNLPKGLDKLGNFGKRIPLLSAILGTAAIVGAPKGEKAKAVGGVGGAIAGGAAGAAGGAAIGSVVPLVGTAIGGLLGGIGGSILGGKGGETIGEWAGKKFGARKAEAAEVTPSGSAPTSDGAPGQMPDFTELNQHAQALTSSLSGMASKAESASHNIEALTMTLGESAGWIAGAFFPLQGATEGLTHNIDALTMTIGESAGWMAGAFYPLQGATEGLVHNISAMTMVAGEASGWIASAFYPLQGTTEGLVHNISAITMTLGEASGWVAEAFYPISGSGAMLNQNTSALAITLGESAAIVASSYLPLAGSAAMVNQNTMALGMVLGMSSAVVAGAYMPLAGAGPMLTGNTMALAMTLGMASGWVASLNGIQAGAAAVKGALSNLAARIASVPTPSVSVGAPSGGRGGPKAYAKGTRFHPGGPAIVGDGGGVELLRYPNGEMALSPSTDTLMNLPRGTEVLTHHKTMDYLNQVPAYAEGIGFSGGAPSIATPIKSVNSATREQLSSIDNSRTSSDAAYSNISSSNNMNVSKHSENNAETHNTYAGGKNINQPKSGAVSETRSTSVVPRHFGGRNYTNRLQLQKGSTIDISKDSYKNASTVNHSADSRLNNLNSYTRVEDKTNDLRVYANGGVVNQPHLGLVGEAGPEAIIPLSSGKRGRAMELFNQTALALGIKPYANRDYTGPAGAITPDSPSSGRDDSFVKRTQERFRQARELVKEYAMPEPIVPGYGESEQPTFSLAGSMAGTVKNTGGSVHVSAPISVEFSGGGQTDEKMIRDIVVNYSREFVEKLREALNNMSR